MIARSRPFPLSWAPVLGLVLAASLLAPRPASAEQTPTPGSAGIGDPYFPHDGNGGIDVLDYDVHDSYAFGTARLRGRTRLDVRAVQDLSRFDLDFLLPVQKVTVDGRRARFRHSGDHELRITPARPLAAGAEFRVSVTYAGRPAAQHSQGESNWLADPREVVAMNEPHMATWWFPADDHPRDKATFDIAITEPRGKRVIANGVLVSKRTRHGRVTSHWREHEPMATYLAFFAAGSFQTHSGSCEGLPDYTAVSRWVPASAQVLSAKELADRTCTIITALSKVLGPYPFDAMGGLVTSLPVSFSLENQTRPTYPGYYEPGGGPDVGLMAHELAHQWFGDSVSVADWRDVWLNEGFAEYLSTYYLTEVLAGHSMQGWLTDTYAGYPAGAPLWDLSIDDPGPARLFDGAVYTRGAMAVQALRHRIGDAAFWTLLQTWVVQRRYGNGSMPDFEALASTISGQDLTSFFDVWLHERVRPAATPENGLG